MGDKVRIDGLITMGYEQALHSEGEPVKNSWVRVANEHGFSNLLIPMEGMIVGYINIPLGKLRHFLDSEHGDWMKEFQRTGTLKAYRVRQTPYSKEVRCLPHQVTMIGSPTWCPISSATAESSPVSPSPND